ncbi:leucine-rich repeat extensin-like protein 5 [Setaria italica]|uniref:leucine-rich repeat extensin-like protein 5 n=1 Tax=Setaria italica TaxID=4555 RepID=UPI000BE61E27|nr:leucine-rich repeat extensin-like protein 5 [Setaria italica]
MDAEEERLRFSLLAAAPGAPADLPIEGFRRAIAELPVAGSDNFSVRQFWPESFLVSFTSQRARDAAMDARFVQVGDLRFSLRPWTRLVRANAGSCLFRVSLELDGIPAHAWCARTARKILAPGCWVEQVASAPGDGLNLRVMKVQGWTDDLARIPKRCRLWIVEHEQQVSYDDPMMQSIWGNPPPYLRQKKGLFYDIVIRLRHVADFRSRSPTPSPSPPSSDGGSDRDGDPDRYAPGGDGVGPRLHGFPTRQGFEDGSFFSGEDVAASGSCSRRVSSAPPPSQTLRRPDAPVTARSAVASPRPQPLVRPSVPLLGGSDPCVDASGHPVITLAASAMPRPVHCQDSSPPRPVAVAPQGCEHRGSGRLGRRPSADLTPDLFPAIPSSSPPPRDDPMLLETTIVSLLPRDQSPGLDEIGVLQAWEHPTPPCTYSRRPRRSQGLPADPSSSEQVPPTQVMTTPPEP